MKTLIIAQGEAFDVTDIEVTDADGVPVDLTGATVKWKVGTLVDDQMTVQSPATDGKLTIPQATIAKLVTAGRFDGWFTADYGSGKTRVFRGDVEVRRPKDL